METPIDRNIGESSETYQSGDYLTIMIAFVTGALVVIIVIFVTVLLRCRHASRFKAAQRKKQGAEWMSPNTENKQNKKKKRKKRKSPKSSLLNFVTIEGNKPDDPAHEPINGTISLPTELEEQGIGRFDWNATPTSTFKPSSPDLARHYKSASPQSAFHLKADTPVSVKKHHVIQELPLDNTFVGGCDTLSKRSSTSSDHFSASESSSQGGFKTKGPMHTRQQGTLTRARTELNPEYLDLRPRAELNPEYWTPCTPLAQDDFYEQASPDKRTEADGNSDPNSDGPLGSRGLVEATEMCTQECLVLGHSDNCWMPPTLGTYQQPKSPMSSYGSQREWGPKDKLLNGHTLSRTWKHETGRSEHFGDRKQFGSGEGHFGNSGIADIPLVNLKSCQSSSCPDSPKDQQL